MAILILAKDGVAVQQFPLLKQRTTIGRRTYNDIVIDAPGISAEHAVVVMTPNEFYFLDLDSTNGSKLDGQAIGKHFLKEGDLIQLAGYSLRYVENGRSLEDESPTLDAAPRDDVSTALAVIPDKQKPRTKPLIKVLKGFGKGREVTLVNPMTTIGRPGIDIAVLTSSTAGYSLTHVQGKTYPRINGESIGLKTQHLSDGDVIALSGTEVMFLY